MAEPIELLDQQVAFSIPGKDGCAEIILDLIDAETSLEDLYENGRRKETEKFTDYLADVRTWIQDNYEIELTVSQAWKLDYFVRQAWAEFKKN